jgi:hypothetical protein
VEAPRGDVMRRRPACASPYHRGDVLLARLDAYERRIEFRRLSDQGREATLLDRIVCRACMRREIAERRGGTGPKTAPLFEDRGQTTEAWT